MWLGKLGQVTNLTKTQKCGWVKFKETQICSLMGPVHLSRNVLVVWSSATNTNLRVRQINKQRKIVEQKTQNCGGAWGEKEDMQVRSINKKRKVVVGYMEPGAAQST